MLKGKIILTGLKDEYDGMPVVFDQGFRNTLEKLMILSCGQLGLVDDAMCIYERDDLKLLAVEYEYQSQHHIKLVHPSNYKMGIDMIGEEVWWKTIDFRTGESEYVDGIYSIPIHRGDWAEIVEDVYTEREMFKIVWDFIQYWMCLSPDERLVARKPGFNKQKYMRTWLKNKKQ